MESMPPATMTPAMPPTVTGAIDGAIGLTGRGARKLQAPVTASKKKTVLVVLPAVRSPGSPPIVTGAPPCNELAEIIWETGFHAGQTRVGDEVSVRVDVAV